MFAELPCFFGADVVDEVVVDDELVVDDDEVVELVVLDWWP